MFKNKYCTIVPIQHTIGISELLKHPNIRNVTVLPEELVMYEFYDSLFEIIHSANQEDIRKIGTDPKLRAEVMLVKKKEQDILKPLYFASTETRYVVKYSLATPNNDYDFPTLGKKQFVFHEAIRNRPDLQKGMFSIYFKALPVVQLNKLQNTIQAWGDWCYREKEIQSHTILTELESISIQANYVKTFEDSAAVLFGLLNILPFKTKIIKVKF